jgi:Fic-DOC domain mobile mystery protein B
MNRKPVPGETPLDDLSGLRLKHIKTQNQLNRAEFDSINKILPKYFLEKLSDRKAPFTYEWVLKVHEEMFGEVWIWAGKLRETEMNIGVKPALIPSELNRLLFDFHKWEKAGGSVMETSARLHHRLVWVHPFRGGNGRWARILTNIYLRKKNAGLIQWPEDEISAGKLRNEYIEALQSADHGHEGLLLNLHKKYQENPG